MTATTDFDPGSAELQVGERLGVWRLQRALSAVPSGRWWRAVHGMSGQAALVLAYERAADAGAVLLRMAQAEGQAWTHPDIAWPLDSGLLPDGRPYVVMPLLEGEPLLQASASASLRRRLDWVMQLCELLLLARAHGLALVELDPSLLWVGPQQQLRLHGLALVPADAGALRMGSLQGQLSAAAQALQCPQSSLGAPGGAQAQVHAVGMLMCLLVNGRLPQEAGPKGATVQALSQWVSLNAASRAALDALLRDAVQSDPARRPADLTQLAAGIEAWLEQTGASAGTGAGALQAAPADTAGGLTDPPTVPTAPAPLTPSPVTAAALSPARRPAGGPPRWLLGVLGLLVIGLASWLLLRN